MAKENKYTDDQILEARKLAQMLLDCGLAFTSAGGSALRPDRASQNRGFLGLRNRWQRKNYGISVYSYEDAAEHGLLPSRELRDAATSALLIRHAEHQAARANGGVGGGNKFYKTKTWLALRYEVLSERGAKCECCGATQSDGAKLQVDHIKPRSKYPELALSKANLQVLCRACNAGKSNRHEDDWRGRALPHSKPLR